MRQLDADLRRFFARRLVRGAFLVVATIILVSIVIRVPSGHEVTASDRAQYQKQVEEIERFRNEQPGALPEGGFDKRQFVIDQPPRDTRVDAQKLIPDALQGTGVALLFLAFVLGASFVGAEYNVGSLTTQLLYEPRRGRVHAAKAVAVATGCAVVAAATLALLIGATYIGAQINGVVEGLDASWWSHRAGEVGRIIAAVAVAGAMAYGVTLVARRTSAGIIAFFLQYPLLFLIEPRRKPFGVISHYMPLRGLLAVVIDPAGLEGLNERTIHTIAGGAMLTFVWVALILVVSGRIFSSAEVR